MDFPIDLADFFSSLKNQSVDRQLTKVIDKDSILDENFSSEVIVPNEDYFTIRLCEMFLKDGNLLFSQETPMAVMVSGFLYGDQEVTIPVFLDNRLLGLDDPRFKNKYIQLKNSTVAGPFPYKGKDLALFTGLFGLEVSNLSKSLFKLFSGLIKTYDPCGLSQYLDIGKIIGENLPGFFGMEECKFKFGSREVYSEAKGAANQLRQNFIAYVNGPRENYPGGFQVRNNSLLYGNKPVTKHDYCLVKIERSDTRSDYTSFPFYKLWQEAGNLILDEAFDKAKYKKIEFLQKINTSPDLTESDKENLIPLFDIKFKTLLHQHQSGYAQNRSGAPSRGEVDSGLIQEKISSSFQSSAQLAEKLHISKRAVQGLSKLKDGWTRAISPELFSQEIKFLKNNDNSKEQADLINSQLAALKTVLRKGKPDPTGLAEALILSDFGTSGPSVRLAI